MSSARLNNSGHISEDDILLVIPISPEASKGVGLVMIAVGKTLVTILLQVAVYCASFFRYKVVITPDTIYLHFA